MGFEANNKLSVTVQNENDYELLKSKLKIIRRFLKYLVYQVHMYCGFRVGITEAKLGDVKAQLDYLSIGEDYFESSGLKIITGERI